MIFDEQLVEWEATAKAATPGPWEHAPQYGVDGRSWVFEGTHHHNGDPDAPDTRMFFDCASNDAAFIALARSAVPTLIDEVRKLQNVAAAAMCLCDTSDEDSLHARLELVAALKELDEVKP